MPRRSKIGRSSLRRSGDDSGGGGGEFLQEDLVNAGGADALEGAVVRINGNSTFAQAQANTAANVRGTIGILQEDTAIGDESPVLTNGRAAVVLMDAAVVTVVAGDNLYVSPTTLGRATNLEPAFPNVPVLLGVVKDASAFGSTGAVVADIDKQQLVDPGAAGSLAANWTVENTRIYAVDFVNGNNNNLGYADPATTSAGDYATACQLAGTRAKKTLAGLALILPRVGADRKMEIVIANGGVNTVQAYADALEKTLGGMTGFSSCNVRGTGTNTTAGCVAFDGSAADATYVGGITGTGLFAAGYNPTGAPTTSVIQCLRVGGAAPAFGATPAVPVGLRLRFDANTATVALRNICRQVFNVTGTDTVLVQTVLPAVPTAGDVFYLEQPGISITPAFNMDAPTTTGIAFAGINFVADITTTTGRFRYAFCTGPNYTSSANDLQQTAQTYIHPVLGTLTIGGGLRLSGSAIANRGQFTWAGFVVVGQVTLSTAVFNFTWGLGCVVRNFIILNCPTAQNESTSQGPNFGVAAGTTVGIPYTYGTSGGSALRIDGSSLTIGIFNATGAGATPAIVVLGKSNVIFKGIPTGVTGNTDVGLDITGARNSFLLFLVTPTLTGGAGDLRVAGPFVLTWAQAVATGMVDTAGNKFFGTLATPALAFEKFTGILFGGVGAVTSQCADTSPVLLVANEVVPTRYPVSQRIITRLRVMTLALSTNTIGNTVTLFKNGVATTMTITVPPATAAFTKFVDAAHPIIYADGDDLSLVMANAGADVAAATEIGATIEYPV